MTFQLKGSRRHSGPMRSRMMRLPALGARGSMSAAGTSASEARQDSAVTPTVSTVSVPPAYSAWNARHGVAMDGI